MFLLCAELNIQGGKPEIRVGEMVEADWGGLWNWDWYLHIPVLLNIIGTIYGRTYL